MTVREIEQYRARANALRVKALGYPEPPASLFAESYALDRLADLWEQVLADEPGETPC